VMIDVIAPARLLQARYATARIIYDTLKDASAPRCAVRARVRYGMAHTMAQERARRALQRALMRAAQSAILARPPFLR